jgi:hypothetical protein
MHKLKGMGWTMAGVVLKEVHVWVHLCRGVLLHTVLAAYNIIILFCIVHIHIIYIVYM